MKKWISRYWVAAVAAGIFSLLDVYNSTTFGLVFIMAVCVFFIEVMVRVGMSPMARERYPSIKRVSVLWIFMFWLFFAQLELALVFCGKNLVTDTFAVQETNGLFPESVASVLVHFASAFCALTILFLFTFMVLFSIKSIQGWKKTVDINRHEN